MRNLFVAIVIISGLISCNDNSNNTQDPTADSAAIESPIDTSNAAMQADTMQKHKVDTTTANPKKTSKKGK